MSFFDLKIRRSLSRHLPMGYFSRLWMKSRLNYHHVIVDISAGGRVGRGFVLTNTDARWECDRRQIKQSLSTCFVCLMLTLHTL